MHPDPKTDPEIYELHKVVKERFPDIHTVSDHDDGGFETYIRIEYGDKMIVIKHPMDWSIVVGTVVGVEVAPNCLEKSPEVRYQNMREATQGVLEVLEGAKLRDRS